MALNTLSSLTQLGTENPGAAFASSSAGIAASLPPPALGAASDVIGLNRHQPHTESSWLVWNDETGLEQRFNEVIKMVGSSRQGIQKRAGLNQAQSLRETDNQGGQRRRRPFIRRRGSSDFYVAPHPLLIVSIPYGLLLTFSAALFPTSIPAFLPLGPLATWLGVNYPELMNGLSLFALSLHLAEPFLALKLSLDKGLRRRETALWMTTALFLGIFGIWPLVFQDFFEASNAREIYCNLPLSLC